LAILRDNRPIKIRVFLEVMGWPKEKLNEHLKEVVGILKKRMDFKLEGENYAEPEKIGEKMYTSHVEFEGQAPSFHKLVMFALLHGPSVLEILDPPELYITAAEMQDILADVIAKVQNMDKDVKLLAAENKEFRDVFAVLEQKGIMKKTASDDKKDEK
jgi:hypothetical protein